MKLVTAGKGRRGGYGLRLAAGLLLVLVVATGYARDLAGRPVHADEATGARILGYHLDGEPRHFDPAHFHGPLLRMLSEPPSHALGAGSWPELEIGVLRLVTLAVALAGLVALLWLERGGLPGEGIAAVAFAASSPLLAYYARMYIHEPLLVGFGAFTALAVWRFLQSPSTAAGLLAGAGIGLMAATRETFVISVFSWAVAGLAPMIEGLRQPRQLRRYASGAAAAAAVATGLILVLYSDFGRNLRGPLDFVRTYFVYELGAGHDKPFGYYAGLLLWPKQAIGAWWTEGLVLLPAILGCIAGSEGVRRRCCFFLGAGLLHLLVYSIIGYKTPWLASLGWLHVCIAAGIGAATMIRAAHPARLRTVSLTAFAALLGWQSLQAARAIYRYPADGRNPYAYVPTSSDAKRVAPWLAELRAGPAAEVPLAVVGEEYWPLPWYLRRAGPVGYWPELPEQAQDYPVLLLLPSAADAAGEALAASHVLIPRGLRYEFPLMVAVDKALWQRYLQQ